MSVASGARGDLPPAVVRGFVVPGMPQPLLAPEKSPAWTSLRASFDRVRKEIEKTGADLLLLYSTQWISVIGHQIQADPAPEWVHVDPEWHELGTMPYRFRMDADYAKAYEAAARARGLHARTVAYLGFPIDTGTIVALKLLNGDNRLPACVVSCNMYADRAETLVLGKAAADALHATGKRAIALAVTALSNRMFTLPIDPKEDRISSLKDDEWNRKLLEILGEGRLEDVSQLARTFSAEANGDQKLKALWWLAALMGEHNDYEGTVYDYQPVWGTGAALVGLVPTDKPAARLEFDEESVEVYAGEQNVLSAAGEKPAKKERERTTGEGNLAEKGNEGTTGEEDLSEKGNTEKERAPAFAASGGASAGPVPYSPSRKRGASGAVLMASGAPAPVGAYAHARRAGNLLYLAGIGPRVPGTNEIPGGPARDAKGNRLAYDVGAQTRQAIENVRTILEEAGSSLAKVLDVTAFLIDMDRDFPVFNRVWEELFGTIRPARTTVAVMALPTPIAVELKVVAEA